MILANALELCCCADCVARDPRRAAFRTARVFRKGRPVCVRCGLRFGRVGKVCTCKGTADAS